MIKEQHQQKVKFAVRRGDFIMAADSLNTLTKLEPHNIACAQLAADMSKKVGADEQAAQHYANIARICIEQGKIQQGMHAISEYYTLCPRGTMIGRELYHLCRTKDLSTEVSLPFLHQQDRLTFVFHENPMFRHVDSDSFTSLLTSLKRVCFNDGDVVVRQGDEADVIFIVVKGALQPWVEEDDGTRYGLILTEAGGVVGETPFLIGTKERTADLIAIDETEVYTLSYQALHSITDQYPSVKAHLQNYYDSHLAERQVAQSPFFRELSVTERRDIAEKMTVVKLAGGETLCTVGEHHALNFYIVILGWLSINTVTKNRESLLYTAKAHSVVGELGILENRRKVTVRAISDVQLLCWSEEDYRAYYRTHESLRHQLTDRLLRLSEKNNT